ncbi:MAG TPA: hypothetical protein VFR64_06450 [Methylomirabilota bacterium]|nr:hypothetical protein [Methylomirabilota bacterium]
MRAGGAPILREGVVGGLIGAAVVAGWFLAFDLARGKPLLTPALLGAALFHGIDSPIGLEVALGPVIGYTLIHGLAFVAFGVVAASVIAATEREPTLIIAVVILFACFETFFLGVVGVLGRAVTDALSWWGILVANFLAAVAMLWYFLLRHRTLPRLLVGSWAGTLREGVVAGLIGAAAVAIWFLVIDTIQGEPFRTPQVLAVAFLKASPGLPAVLLYTLVHGVAFVVFGIIAAVLIAGAERDPMLVFALVIGFTAFEVGFFGAVAMAARWVLDEVAGWTILAGNLLAAVSMLAYFFKGHRALARRMATAWEDD